MTLRWLLDTNVISEIRKRRPNPDVMEFLGAQEIEETCLSAITLAELRKGAARARARGLETASELEEWIDKLQSNYDLRILAVDEAVANEWGKMMAERDRPVNDTFIAATAVTHGLTLVTRNVRDFEGLDVTLLNPWE